MYEALLREARFHELLLRFDEDLARSYQAQGCSCGGVLHLGLYRRKPRGVPPGLPPQYAQRWSFCCARCRKRATPPSLRFMGPKVYVASTVILISAMRCGITPVRLRELFKLVGVSRRTVIRWQEWWREEFTASALWKLASGLFIPPVRDTDLPCGLLERFVGTLEQQLLGLLRFMAPLSCRDGLRLIL